MMKLDFKDITEEMFNRQFPDEEACYAWLAAMKWEAEGFRCRKCGHDNSCHGKKPHSKRCTRCKTEESATAHTPFHRCRIPIREAFRIAWLCCNQPGVSSYALSREMEIRQMTCWKFKTKMLNCLPVTDGKNSESA